MTKRERFLLKRSLEVSAFHYIRACTSYAADGYVKAENHLFISKEIFAFIHVREPELDDHEAVDELRDNMRVITDYLDETIGLPLDTPLAGNEWDPYVDKFLDEIIKVSIENNA